MGWGTGWEGRERWDTGDDRKANGRNLTRNEVSVDQQANQDQVASRADCLSPHQLRAISGSGMLLLQPRKSNSERRTRCQLPGSQRSAEQASPEPISVYLTATRPADAAGAARDPRPRPGNRSPLLLTLPINSPITLPASRSVRQSGIAAA